MNLDPQDRVENQDPEENQAHQEHQDLQGVEVRQDQQDHRVHQVLVDQEERMAHQDQVEKEVSLVLLALEGLQDLEVNLDQQEHQAGMGSEVNQGQMDLLGLLDQVGREGLLENQDLEENVANLGRMALQGHQVGIL